MKDRGKVCRRVWKLEKGEKEIRAGRRRNQNRSANAMNDRKF